VDVWLDGMAGNDTLVGSNADREFFFGGNGDDYVDGRGGFDVLAVGAQSAAVVDFRTRTVTGGGEGGTGSVSFVNIEFVYGQGFNDVFISDDAGCSMNGGRGDDRLFGGAGNDELAGDGVLAPYHVEGVFRWDGQDLLVGRAGNDWLNGGAGDDTLFGGAGRDTLHGGFDTDPDYDYVRGGAGKDYLFLGSSVGVLDGDRGIDTLLVTGNLDLRSLPNDRLADIEVIKLDRSMAFGNRIRVTLTRADVLDISSTTDTLKVLGDHGDSVNIVGPYKDLGVSGGFHRYKLGAGVLLVDTDITNVG
jgi:Ca2+-binding RTX toxin-like protein